MPWTTADVDRHKRGLTDQQKRQWVRIANSVLSRCLSGGGQRSTCEGSAIRQASGVVGNSNTNDMEKIIQANNSYDIRTEMHQGRSQIVVPVIMMVEGVHDGSQGPLFHSAAELGKVPGSWNGIPVVVGHPEEDGQNVSANSPEVIDREVIGRVYNTHMDGAKLKAEAWLDEEKLRQMNPLALAYIRQGRPLDVSIGVFTDDENVPGEWNGERYDAIARNHRPDHLALLPGGTGACSWDDGCGVRTNTNKEGGNEVNEEVFVKGKDLSEAMKSLSKKGLVVIPINNNEQGYRTLVQSIQTKLDSMDNDFKTYYLQEVFEDYFIYEVRKRDEGSTLYKDGYNVQEDETVEFTEEPTEVRRDVKYVTMSFKRTNFNNNQKKEVKTMSELKKTPCPDRVDELIALESTKYTEKDKEWLLTQEADNIEKMFPNEPEVKKETPQINVEDVKKAVIKALTWEEIEKKMPKEKQDQFSAGWKLYQEQREKTIKGILDSTEDVWTEESLKAMEDETLKKVSKSVKVESDFSLLSVQSIQVGGGQEPLYLGGIEIEKETKK